MIEIIRREISRALAGLRAPFRGVLSAPLKHRTTAPNLGTVEGLAGEPLPDIELMKHAGVAAGLPAGTPVIVVPVGGRSGHSVIIASDSGTYRVDVGVGEVALYHLTEPNCHVWLKAGRVVGLRGRVIELKADEEVVLDAPTTRHTGNTQTTGNAQVTGTVEAADVLAGGKSGKTHTHTETGSTTLGPN